MSGYIAERIMETNCLRVTITDYEDWGKEGKDHIKKAKKNSGMVK